MGLDMYLTASKYVGGWKHCDKSEKATFNKILKSIKLSPSDVSLSCQGIDVNINIGYWRKAWQIHKWFVQKIQNNIDDCRKSYVSKEHLKELKHLCKTVLKTKDTSYMPSTDMVEDEQYFRQIEDTIKIINIALSDKFEDFQIHYQASW